MHSLQLLLQAGSESRSVGLDLSRRPPSAGQAPLAVLRGSLGIAHVQLSCVTYVGLVCVVEHCDLTELKEVLLLPETPTYTVMCLFQLFAALCDHNLPTLQTERQTDEQTVRRTTCCSWHSCSIKMFIVPGKQLLTPAVSRAEIVHVV